MGCIRRFGGKLGQKLALAPREILRRLDNELHEQVARIACTQHRHALAAQPQLSPRLGAFRHADPGLGSIERPDIEFAAKRGLHHRDRDAAIKVCAVALEERVRLYGEENIDAPRRTAAHPRLALAGQADAGAVLDAGGNVDRQRTLPRHAAGAGAFVARVFNRLPAAVTGGAGALDGEETLLRPHTPMSAAGLAGRGPRAGARPGAGAGFASDRSRHANSRGLAVKRLFERDLEVIAQVSAALSARGLTAASPAHHIAEQIIEDVGHRLCKAVAHAALIEGGVTVAVVSRALLGVRQMLIGFVQFLEPRLGLLVAGVPVGMTLHRRLAEGGLQFGLRRRFGDAQSFVEIALGHRSARPESMHASNLLVPRRLLAGRPACPRPHLPPPLRRPLSSRPATPARPALFVHGFFLSSSTSRNSASMTSSLACAPVSAPPWPGAPLACWALYVASPSFICACIRSLVRALIASTSSPCNAVRREATADSMALRSDWATLSPYSFSAFSASCASDSPWFLASTISRRFLSSAAWASASFTIRLMSASLKPPDAWMRICCSLLVALSLAVTLTMPLASMSNVTSICGTPRGAPGIPTRSNWPSALLSAAISRSPWKTRMVTAV